MTGRPGTKPVGNRLLVLLVPLLLPWTLVLSGGAVSLVFPWGLVSAWPLPLHAVSLPRYLLSFTTRLPRYLRAWPWSTFLYACALGTAIGSYHPHRAAWLDEDTTAWLLALAGLGHLSVSVGVWRSGRLALPLGTVVLLTLAWAVHGDAVLAEQ